MIIIVTELNVPTAYVTSELVITRASLISVWRICIISGSIWRRNISKDKKNKLIVYLSYKLQKRLLYTDIIVIL